jgi:ABC-type multidrug transport system fused ATPase/permease subunit
MVALVGHSGAGKSTVFALLNRWYDPGNTSVVGGMSSGQVLVDGVDMRAIDPRWLRAQVAMVAQEPVLFAMSIADNIAYGYSHLAGATSLTENKEGGEGEEAPCMNDANGAAEEKEEETRSQGEAAARLSNAHNFIEEFPEGACQLWGCRGCVSTVGV